MTPLKGHTSPETAYVVADYPYGFKLRCQIRYWIETKPSFGQRVVSQTTNPKKPGVVWNKPKASTYSPVVALFLDEAEHVQWAALSVYDDVEATRRFIDTYRDSLDNASLVDAEAILRARVAYAERRAAGQTMGDAARDAAFDAVKP